MMNKSQSPAFRFSPSPPQLAGRAGGIRTTGEEGRARRPHRRACCTAGQSGGDRATGDNDSPQDYRVAHHLAEEASGNLVEACLALLQARCQLIVLPRVVHSSSSGSCKDPLSFLVRCCSNTSSNVALPSASSNWSSLHDGRRSKGHVCPRILRARSSIAK